ncbi:hypothetical protein K431DRAFT_222232, partial [Polychaeton citri CBS 116435]
LDGDGDPHQNYYEVQVTDNLNCGMGGTGCSVSHLNSHTLGYTVSAGATLIAWISGGFSVDESYTTGETFTCDANPGDTVCVWDSISYTAYTVINLKADCSAHGDPYVLKSPNSDNSEGGYYCVYGSACRSDGQGYWNNNGRAGGP